MKKKLSKVFVDTAPFIYFMEDTLEFSEHVNKIFMDCQAKNIAIYTSTITYFEFCVKPYEVNKYELITSFKELLLSLDIQIMTIDVDTCDLAARLRAKYKSLTPMDSLQLASAITTDCKAFITNDKKLKKTTEIKAFLVNEWEVK